ncbi:MAG: LLM class flavin-dependent oxidoreductase [Acidimicrobiales bacterium]
MKLGVLLPTFREGARDALEFATQAADSGVDGVFAYDHLWPMGSPQRPSLAPFPLLVSVARRHEHLWVGPLVARVGLVSSQHLIKEFETLASWAPGRVIAALGTGDRLSAQENIAYGLGFQDADERRGLLREAATELRAQMPVWIGAGAEATNALARELEVEINVWDATPARVAQLSASGPTNWAGPAPDDLISTLDALDEARATWAVFSPQIEIARLKAWRDAR